jgi:hypothetical protein
VTPIADMIEKMVAEGVPMHVIVLAVRTAEIAMSGGSRVDIKADTAAERRRAYDRERKRQTRHLRLPDGEWYPLVQQILERDGRKCKYCGNTEKLTADHVIPMTRGGTHNPSNLVACCIPCNTKKGNRLVAEWLPVSAEFHPISADTGFASSLTPFPLNNTQKGEGRKEEAKSKRRTGIPLPDDWQPSEDHYADAATAHRTRDQVDAKAEEMRLWAKANGHRAVARKLDWDATFTGWMRRDWGKGGQNAAAQNRPAQTGWQQSRDKWREAHAELKASIAAADAGGEECGPALRFVPPAGRG